MNPSISFQPGDTVPDFTLPAVSGEQVTLSGFRGQKVVLYFYPKDMTPTCTQEACDFRDIHPQLIRAGAVLIGISPDGIASHARFRDKHDLPFLLLSDSDHKVCEQYGVWKPKKMYGREYMGVERSTFLIDEQGKLMREWRKVKVKGHAEEVLQTLLKSAR